MNLLIGILVGITLTSFLCLYRLILGPTVFDRIVVASALTTKTIVVVAVLAVYFEQPMYLEISITYAMLSFLAVLGVAAYIVQRRAQP